jgi:proteasome accessory factor C
MSSPPRQSPHHSPGRRPKRGALGAEARLSRLLVMLPWLMERREVPLDDVAATFSMSRDEVVRELELASMCGLPPFVDELIDVFIDEETVFVGVPRLFTKPLRLTAPEGFALLTAGRAAMQLPGADPDSPLGRGLSKLAAVLGEEPDSDPALVVDLAATDLVDEFVAATKRVERLTIRYWTASRDEVSERDITPRRVFHERGDWYVSADDHRSGERRTFRIDRVESYERTGVFDDPLGDDETDDGAATSSVSWSVDGSLPRVTLRLQPAARWVIEQYPFDSVVERPRGVVDATFAVTSERWLERLLLRAGIDAEVVTPTEYVRLAVDAATRVLARYT